jgi:DNA recombination protein RmuC
MVLVAIVIGTVTALVVAAFVVAVAGAHLRVERRATAREGELQRDALDRQFGSMGDELRRMQGVVEALRRERAQQHGQVLSGLAEASRSTAALTDTTARLREALASPKARGQWGERMADDVLRLAGMVEGVNYRKQTATAAGTVPDVTFLLPGDLLLHMDVKFPADNYLRSLEAVTAAERDAAETAFLRDVRRRVKELSGRQYIDPATTVDQMLLFIPNESIYGFVHQHDPGLVDAALSQRVVLCSPFTLFAVLAVIRQAVDTFQLERASDEILQCLAAFGEQWTKFSEQLDLVGRRLQSAQQSFDDLAGSRRRQLQRRLDRIDDLRAQRGLGDGEAPPVSGPGRRWPEARAG